MLTIGSPRQVYVSLGALAPPIGVRASSSTCSAGRWWAGRCSRKWRPNWSRMHSVWRGSVAARTA